MAKRQNILVADKDTGRTSRVKRKAWSLCGTSLPVLQYHRGLASATVSSFSKWEHKTVFVFLPLTKKIWAEVDGLGHSILWCGIIPRAALLTLKVPSLKGAIQPGSK